MSRIRILDRAVAERIAAGEVVERPASVVKELVENSLDAAATQIVVEITGAGSELIRVSDDGVGIQPDDLPLAIQRFATSKIATSDDLLDIRSFGFRGEALPSIAAVSHLEITSSPSGAVTGRQVRLTGGIVTSDEGVGGPPGTTVEVRNLFFNTPARRKFLKSSAREFGLIVDTINRLALPHPRVAFRLIHGDNEALRYPSGTAEDRVASVLGAEAYARILRCEEGAGEIPIMGWLGRPELARSTRTHQYAFVNLRSAHSRVITGAVEEAYRQLLPAGHFPLFIVCIDLPPPRVDVNIHPRKLEVRFDDDHQVFGAVLRTVRSTLSKAELVRPVEHLATRTTATPMALELNTHVPAGGVVTPIEVGRSGRLPAMRLLGQLHATYLLAQSDEGLIIIDQHAAHERILYERLWRRRARGMVNEQVLVTPVPCELTPGEAATLAAHLGAQNELGFDLEPFGDRVVLVRAVPEVAIGSSPEQLLRDLLAELADMERITAAQSLAERLTIATACRTAIKAGDLLNGEQMAALVRDLAETEDPFTCFHGRPTVVTVPLAHLERWFFRK